jgi:hypothetical protein
MKTIVILALTGAALVFGAPALAADPSGDAPSAQQQCRSERDAMGVQVFRQTYGTNKNRHNAFGKCVSHRAKATAKAGHDAATVADQVAAEINAAAACKQERSDDPAAFKAKYGTNRNKRNAFGKCVSKTAKAKLKHEKRQKEKHPKKNTKA